MHFVTNPRDVKSKTSSLQPSSISELGVLLNLHAAVLVDTGDGGKGMVRDTMVAKELAALGKAFLYQEAHAHNLCAALAAKVDNAAGSMAIGQEIVYKENPVIGGEKLAVYAHSGSFSFGE